MAEPDPSRHSTMTAPQQQEPYVAKAMCPPSGLPALPKVEEVTEIDARDKQTADDWVPRHKGLIRLTGRHPFNCEPAPDVLVDAGFITPVPIHYVRNHGAVPKLTWEDHKITVNGLGIQGDKVFTMDELVNMEQRSIPVTLVCAGNRRKEVNMHKPSKGFSWGPAAVSTSVWTGVPLHRLLTACGIDLASAGPNAHVCFDGPDLELHHGTYGTSVPIGRAMDPAQDILIAFQQNGESLKPDHGYPVRIIIPGYIGGRMIKWLTRISVSNLESQSHYHYYDNRVLPSMVDNDRADKEDWWHRPDYIINDLNLNSAITHPAHAEEVVVGRGSGHYTVKGYAYSGGGRRVTRVELSFDEGETWEVVKLSSEEYPTEHGRFWCWRLWECEVDVLRLVGGKQLMVRAWDDCQNTQPRDLTWNVMGMMNNSWYRVKTAPCRTSAGELAVRMIHPVVAGPTPGGWMIQKVSAAAAAPSESKGGAPASDEPALPKISPVELAKHNKREDCWIAVAGKVYDVTPYLAEHPGGLASLVGGAGRDVTEDFEGIHSPKAWAILKKFVIGVLDASAPVGGAPGLMTAPAKEEDKATPTPTGRLMCRLASKTEVSTDIYVLRFALPSSESSLNMAVGYHVQLRARIENRLVLRSYTPISEGDTKGYFDLLIRVYRANQHPKFPQGGLMSQHLDSLPVGGSIEVDPPHGHIIYEGRGRMTNLGEKMSVKHFACVAGGTGITPIWQVLRAVLSDEKDETTLSLLYASRSPNDLLLRKELNELAAKHPTRFQVWYTVDTMEGYDEAKEGPWGFSMGFVSEEMLGKVFPKASADVAVLQCGPPPMLKFAVKPALDKMGFKDEQCFSF